MTNETIEEGDNGDEGALTPIGYWRSGEQPDLPDPADLVDESWDPLQRAALVAALRVAIRAEPGAGCSWCRICGQPNGFVDITDGTYVWPEGLWHYVADHGVRLPDDIAAHLTLLAPSDVRRLQRD